MKIENNEDEDKDFCNFVIVARIGNMSKVLK
jgi:hypothetical protein